jgi:predicted ATP-grasp superfamily ATP-dependent carboligase
MDHGRTVKIFMHHRLREDPPTGGPSTAAHAYFSERLKDCGLRLLQALRWHGAAMVEFKLDSRSEQFVLMEINGKLWGSLELALRSGVNFGADLVRLYRGETLQYSEEYDRQCHFYWPLDSDLRTIWKTRNFGAVRDYFKPDASTNVGQSLRADILKTGALLWHLMQR